MWEDIGMRRALICFVCAIGLAYSGGADAASPKRLKGEYAFTGSGSCLFAPGSDPGPGNPTPGVALPNSGFNANLQPVVNATAFSSSRSIEGVRVFHPDGTGTVTGTNVFTTERPTPGPTGYPSFPSSAGSNTISASFTYTVNSDDTIVIQQVGPLTGTFLTGPRSGQTVSVDVMTLTGLISKDGNTLTLATVATTVETVTFSNGDVWPRICHRSQVLIKMDKD
jgi:putative alpha-1,2-mannosidase